MKYRLDEDHHIDEMVLPAGTVIGDDTDHPFRSTYEDRKIGRSIGDPLPPSVSMTPLDAEAQRLFNEAYGEDKPEHDPTKSIPLTGAENAPKVPGISGPKADPRGYGGPVNPAPVEAPRTGMNAPNPPGHDSAKNPGDSKDTQTARTPDIKKI